MSRDSAFFSSVRSHHKGSSLVSTSAVPPLSPSLFLSSPLPLWLFLFLSPHLHLSVFPQLTYSHCIYCLIPFPNAAAERCVVAPIASSFVHLPLTLVNLISHLAAKAALHSHHAAVSHNTVSTPTTNRCVFYSTTMEMSERKEDVAKLNMYYKVRSLDQQRGKLIFWLDMQYHRHIMMLMINAPRNSSRNNM